MKYKLLIVAATIIWGSSFVIVKDTTDYLLPAWLLACRFVTAAIILGCVFIRRREHYFKPDYLLCGAAMGCMLFGAYVSQTYGIMDTTPGKNAFITGAYVVMVPFFAFLFTRARITKFNVAAALLCLTGIGLLSLSGDSLAMGRGDALTLLGAVFYALHIIVVAKVSQGRDIFVLTVWQFAVAGVLALVWACLLEEPPAWSAVPTATWVGMAYLAIGCTAVALLFQNVGQAHLEPATAALLLSLESPFGTIFSVALGAEVLTMQTFIGFAFIFFAIVVSETQLSFLKKRSTPTA